jgi:hypothetical protein
MLAAAEASTPFPGPGPWDLRAWCGAALYVALFAVALRGVWALVRSDGRGGGEERP